MNFKKTNIVFLYDETFEGLLTVIHFCLKYQKIPKEIIKENNYFENLLDKPVFVETNINNAKNVLKHIKSDYVLFNIYISFLVDKTEMKIVNFVLDYFMIGCKIINMKNIKSVIDIEKCVKRVNKEKHRYKGFIRFKKLKNNVYISKINPDYNILTLVAPFFKDRLKNDCWIIYDEKRNIAAFYDKKTLKYEQINIIDQKVDNIFNEDQYELMWKTYFNKISIKERTNQKCQLNFMPKRYWSNMLEVKK